jgi:hypothetical protein
MKTGNYAAAVLDCSRCIDLAPENVKAFLRCACSTALQHSTAADSLIERQTARFAD